MKQIKNGESYLHVLAMEQILATIAGSRLKITDLISMYQLWSRF
ncbi:hypothetical protein F383_08993 [Gossypium arboreum]|uniref:Uncharacterized protein n=1 Tax=Gossypium arboreum TaxID=29729 RepID=A0A0B0P587_GOSAR|nr:hypothetical protein F383_08993 [Gossypium arboreum]